ncbi:hypothetical protein BABINDRAFT_12145 [Babjeviella inositovora NRRL Y-12698]|uniref:Uncharacterized protein n=1 Tax=Babjeviella inositovora NRRL Y-12698 TaxID=984486 RepID=A0A1E3QWT6_9ASCO|nr:uncharacterized protein BABINDRAFT_12145 [Babjeviella inositovora NRRL Y-12698]ODQ82101.1 hypothetical protein BABINDRAFT_12145 [Babjeviella inositovora NRRL Y-12698]
MRHKRTTRAGTKMVETPQSTASSSVLQQESPNPEHFDRLPPRVIPNATPSTPSPYQAASKPSLVLSVAQLSSNNQDEGDIIRHRPTSDAVALQIQQEITKQEQLRNENLKLSIELAQLAQLLRISPEMIPSLFAEHHKKQGAAQTANENRDPEEPTKAATLIDVVTRTYPDSNTAYFLLSIANTPIDIIPITTYIPFVMSTEIVSPDVAVATISSDLSAIGSAATTTDSLLVSNIKSFGSGAFGGVCALLTGHPFDLVKVQLQTGQHPSASAAVRATLAASGPLGLYRGVIPPLVGVTPIFAVSFWGYDVGKNLVSWATNKNAGEALSTAEISAAGFFSAIPTTGLTAPFERIKVVLQTSKTQTLMFGATREILRAGGLPSLFKGSVATLARDGPGSAVYFATYEILKKKWSPENGDLSLVAVMGAGGFAGVAMWMTIYPFDTIKSRQQASLVKMSISEVSRGIYKTSGIKGFFPGLGPALCRSFPANAACFLGVEVAKSAFNKVL